MPTLDDVYRKFGETFEAGQLLETELGTILLMIEGTGANHIESPDPVLASVLYQRINRQTLGQLLRKVQGSTDELDHLEALFTDALKARNQLSHAFYRKHNFRRNSDDGRKIMLDDLEAIHRSLLAAYKAVMRFSGIDLDAIDYETIDPEEQLPKGHVPI